MVLSSQMRGHMADTALRPPLGHSFSCLYYRGSATGRYAVSKNLGRLIDRRFQGTAVGVGSQAIVGRIHALDLKIGTSTFTCSFHVLQGDSIDVIFGLDQLKRHSAVITLGDNPTIALGGNEPVPFLSDEESGKMRAVGPLDAAAAGLDAEMHRK